MILQDIRKSAEMMDVGWIPTGDISKMDEDGYIIDLDSDVIITDGMNVYSIIVERVIQQHDQVGNAAVIGVPHDEWGEVAKTVIVPEDDTIDRDALWAFCDDQLADYERPKSFDVVDKFRQRPMGSSIRNSSVSPTERQLTRDRIQNVPPNIDEHSLTLTEGCL